MLLILSSYYIILSEHTQPTHIVGVKVNQHFLKFHRRNKEKIMAADARVRYTKMVIRENFVQLYAQKPLSQITVKDICERAEINRATFYRHYADVYDLKEKLEEEMVQSICSLIHGGHLETAHENILTILHIMKNNQERYITLHQLPNSALIVRIVQFCFQDNLKYLHQKFPHYSETELRWYFEYICLGAAGVMINWVNHGMQESPETVARFIFHLIEKDSKH